MTSPTKRISNELADLCARPVDKFLIEKDNSNLAHWYVQMIGPKDTPYYGGLFKLSVSFGANYPFEPPIVKFVTKIFHPNISEHGIICMDILKASSTDPKDQVWRSDFTMRQVFLAIYTFLKNDPNVESPLNIEAAEMYKRQANHKDFYQAATEMTVKYAK